METRRDCLDRNLRAPAPAFQLPLVLCPLVSAVLAMALLNLKIEFGGGLELLFSNQRSHRITIPAKVPASSNPRDADKGLEEKPADVTYLMYWLRDNLLKEREELFIENGTV